LELSESDRHACSGTLVDLLNARHARRVEWLIVALIFVEILLTLHGRRGR